MKTERQVKAWLRIKLKNLHEFLGDGSYSTMSTGIRRVRTRLKELLDQLDKYIEEMKGGNKNVKNKKDN